MVSTEPEQAIYYERSDYLGVGRRLLIEAIDVALAAAVSLVITFLARSLLDGPSLSLALLLAWPCVWFAYFVVLKASSSRTVGYLAAGARIVNLAGERPGIASLTVRFLFAVIGPINCGFDLLWIPVDPAGQSLRDKFTRTYVVKNDARPRGVGEIRYTQYSILGASFLFAEVSQSGHSLAS